MCHRSTNLQGTFFRHFPLHTGAPNQTLYFIMQGPLILRLNLQATILTLYVQNIITGGL